MLIIWHNPSAFQGETVKNAHDAALAYFQAEPDIIFVILPERGECLHPCFSDSPGMLPAVSCMPENKPYCMM